MSFLYHSPVGMLGFDDVNGAISALHWGRPGTLDNPRLEAQLRQELDAYFDAELSVFSVPLALQGSEFQIAFLRSLCAIPYGETRTYGELARELSVSNQAIGQACGANRIAILVPCHRVLAANGLGGYSGDGGIETKVTLLKLERAGGLLI